MKPYYHDERAGIQIWHGDCRDILPLLGPVDLVLTDPPFGIEGGRGSISKARGKGQYEPLFVDNPAYIESVIVPIIKGLIHTVPCVVLTPGAANCFLYPQPQSFGVFYQPAAKGLQTFGWMDASPILYYGKNPTRRNMGIPCSYVLTEAPEVLGHPCAKPIRAWSRLLANISLVGHCVLDPFMGVGTTIVAAKNLGRRAVGIELSEAYCERAVERLQQETLLLDLLDDQPQPNQGALFAEEV